MTNQQILEKAIKKAIAGGWVDGRLAIKELNAKPEFALSTFWPLVIFNHSFAKALWGDSDHNIVRASRNFSNETIDIYVTGYKFHLQRMVIAEDPIKYLGENI